MGIKGFVTVATGDEKYYALAANLYLSYKRAGEGKYPFALICDRKNEFSEFFDDVILVEDIRKSTVDKLLMQHSPYDESIFIDADTLILQNIDDLWDVFADQDDVSVFGCTLPLDSKNGWFTYEGCGKYRPRVHYLISMNGGIYFFRKTPKARQVFSDALGVMDDFASIDFKYFSTPQDEPLMAMAMVLNGCKPCEKKYDMIILPACGKRVSTDYAGNVYENKQPSPAKMIHFSTRRTVLFLYNYLSGIHRSEKCDRWQYIRVKLRYAPEDIKFNVYHSAGAVLRKIGFDPLVDKLKKVLS